LTVRHVCWLGPIKKMLFNLRNLRNLPKFALQISQPTR
jgi:hypothetical protein